jgi:hypothetical protein
VLPYTSPANEFTIESVSACAPISPYEDNLQPSNQSTDQTQSVATAGHKQVVWAGACTEHSC